MKKKISFTLVALSIIATTTTFTGCKSAAQKEVAAQNDVVEARTDLKEAKKDLADQKEASAEEWEAFKADAKIRIAENNKRILELKAKINDPKSTHNEIYAKKIANLEQKNKDMSISMENYENNKSSDWQVFKRTFNQDMDQLGKALNDMVTEN